MYARQANDDMTAMTTVDDDGWLPLHRALKDDAPLGSIKLLMRANPAAVQVADHNGVLFLFFDYFIIGVGSVKPLKGLLHTVTFPHSPR